MSTHDKILTFLSNFVESPVSNHDPLRNKEFQIEYLSAYLAACTILKNEKIDELVREVLDKGRRGHLWEEKGYHPSDEPFGHYGAVPSAYALIALSLSFSQIKDQELKQRVLENILLACDELYGQENDGFFKKSSVNKSNVLNTNLLASMAYGAHLRF